jgi:hypothetical protein
MRLRPYVVAIVAGLIREGRAGAAPFGIRLETWVEEIKRMERVRQLELKLDGLETIREAGK